MKTPRPESDLRWEKLLQQARADVGPPADLNALLRVVRAAPSPASVEERAGWAAEFFALVNAARLVPLCLGGTAAIASVVTWQVWEWWEALPWAQLLMDATGGVS